jgi:hypothetical protein
MTAEGAAAAAGKSPSGPARATGTGGVLAYASGALAGGVPALWTAAALTGVPAQTAGSASRLPDSRSGAGASTEPSAPSPAPAPAPDGSSPSSAAAAGVGFLIFLGLAGLLLLGGPSAARRMRLAGESYGVSAFVLIPERPG